MSLQRVALRQLLAHPDAAVVEQGIELARSIPAALRLSVVAELLGRDDPWLCLAIAGTDPDTHASRFARWCAEESLRDWKGAEAELGRRVITALGAGEPAAGLQGEIDALHPLIVQVILPLTHPAGRASAMEAMMAARTLSCLVATLAAEARAKAARQAMWRRSRDAGLADNISAVSRRESRLILKTAREDASLLQRTELYQRCEALIREGAGRVN